MAPKFRADHVGSFIRPQALLDAYESLDAKDAQLAATKTAIAHVAQKQLELDIRPITSGEYERTSFIDGFFDKLQGMTVRDDFPLSGLRTNLPATKVFERFDMQTVTAIVATGKIKRVSPAFMEAWEMLRANVPEANWKDCKIALPSPTWHHLWLAPGRAYEAGVYASDREYLTDLTTAYREELKDLYDAGLRSVQIDDPQLLNFILDAFTDGIRGDGIDPADLLDEYLWALNEIVRDKPADLYVGIHICRGNMPGVNEGFLSGSYEKIAEKLFKELNYDTFYLEFDDERSGSFEPLRFLQKGQSVTLGLVTTKYPELEDLDKLKARVHQAAEVIAAGQQRLVEEVLKDSLAVSPQCGFASTHTGQNVGSEDRMWDKLVLVRDLARAVWEDAV
ncbi:hypothetical protein F5Y18DRAFT_414075 [Xylariaceae sp. FL1019]|nr:hypothetical protein F5Y18DRAFT_414075 [Xylariaceae sp. FL1019]